MAAWIWSSPPRPRGDSYAVPMGAKPLTATLSGKTAHGFFWPGQSVEAGQVLVQHGWGGSVAGIRAVIDALLPTGKSVVAFDAFAHGTSGWGRHGRRQSSLIELSDLVLAIDREHGPFDAVIAHSAGAPAVTRAFRQGMRVSKAVFLSPLVEPLAQAHLLSEALGLSGQVAARWPEMLLERFGATRQEIDMCPPPGSAPSLLIVHDRDDAFSPSTHSSRLRDEWSDAKMIETQGLGHYRIVNDPEVLARIGQFLFSGGGA